MINKKIKFGVTIPLLLIGFVTSFFTVENKIKEADAVTQITNPTMQDFVSLIADSKEHYQYSDSYIESYQQASGGYIDFAKKTGHTRNASIHEPNQKWHFLESWLFQSFEDGTLTWGASAKTRVYSNLKCPELLLWIFEASGVDSNKLKTAYDTAVADKIAGKTTNEVASDIKKCILWDDVLAGLNKKEPLSPITPIEPYQGVTVGLTANYLISKLENYSISDSYIESYQPASGGYIDFATAIGHPINKIDHEPNQKWNFFENYLIQNLKSGNLYWEGNAKTYIYDMVETPELFLWLSEALGTNNLLISAANVKARADKELGKSDIEIMVDMKEIISYDAFIENVRKQIQPVIVNVPDVIALNVNNVEQLEPELSTGGGTFSYSSDDDTIASVSNNGLITGNNEGSANITITNNEDTTITKTVLVNVTKPGPEGEEKLYSTCLFGPTYNSKSTNRYESSWSATNEGFTWNIINFSNGSNKWDYVKAGSEASPMIGTITTATAYAPAISKVVITIGAVTKSKINSVSLSYGPSTTNYIQTINMSNIATGEYTFNISNPAVNQFYKLTFNCLQGSSNGLIQVNKIEYYKKNYSDSYLADSYGYIFKSIMKQKCIAPYNVISPTDWNNLAEEYNSLSSTSKTKFKDQYNLYKEGQSEKLYSEVFATYIFITRDKYFWKDYMELGIEPNKSLMYNMIMNTINNKNSYIIYIVIGSLLVFSVVIIIKKKKKIIE